MSFGYGKTNPCSIILISVVESLENDKYFIIEFRVYPYPIVFDRKFPFLFLFYSLNFDYWWGICFGVLDGIIQ